MFNCSHCNNGICRKYSTLDVDVPCSGNGDCEGYEVVDEIGFPHWASEAAYNNGYAKGVKEFAEKIDKHLKRYSNLHKHANEARHSIEEYADGTPMEMVSVWEVLSLQKWEMVEYETMNTLQDNIETIAKERLLTEFEKDFLLLVKEMVGADNG